MADSKYGRLFTEADAFQLVWEALGGSMGGVEVEEARASFSRVLRELDAIGNPELGLTFPADEPLFLLRGQDKLAPNVIAMAGDRFDEGDRTYYVACDDGGASADHVAAVGRAADAMREWQAAHPERVKVPD